MCKNSTIPTKLPKFAYWGKSFILAFMKKLRRKYGSYLVIIAFVFVCVHRFSSSFDSAVILCEPVIDVRAAAEGDMKQDSEGLIHYIRDYILWPPDPQQYNLSNATTHKYSRDNIEQILSIIFNNKEGGTFFEAGAFDGEIGSNTLYLEKEKSWSGLLVEGSSANLAVLKTKHRKSWVAPVLICGNTHPQKIIFYEAGLQSWMKDYQPDLRGKTYRCPPNDKVYYFPNITEETIDILKESNCSIMKVKETAHQCFPLYSLLMAAGITTVDYMSLDIEGAELHVIDSLPLEKLNIKILHIEVVFTGLFNKTAIADKMKTKGYTPLYTLGNVNLRFRFAMDMIFIKDGLSLPVL